MVVKSGIGGKAINAGFGLLLAGVLAGCGGSGDAATLVEVEGQAANGYLYNAKVCLDLNANQLCDADEPTAVSGNEGRFLLTGITREQRDNYAVVVEVDADETLIDGAPAGRSFVLEGVPGQHRFVSPFTTLVGYQLRQGLSLQEAEDELSRRLEEGGIPSPPDLLADYIKENRWELGNMASLITGTMAGFDRELSSESADPGGEFTWNQRRDAALDEICLGAELLAGRAVATAGGATTDFAAEFVNSMREDVVAGLEWMRQNPGERLSQRVRSGGAWFGGNLP